MDPFLWHQVIQIKCGLHSDGKDASSVLDVLYASPLKFISQGYASSGSLHSLGFGDGL